VKTYECPKCLVWQTCLGSVVGHQCPSNQSKWVPGSKWRLVPQAEVDARPKPKTKRPRSKKQ
jgi:hypothetical protein